MPPVETHPAILALQTQLLTMKDTWGLKTIDAWPSYAEGTGGPAISLELSGIKPVLFQGSYPNHEYFKVYQITISYWSSHFRPPTNTHNVYNMLDAILDHLLENIVIGNYNLFDQGTIEGPGAGNIPTSDPSRELFGGQMIVPMTQYVTRVQS